MKLPLVRPLSAWLLLTSPLWPACTCDGTGVNSAEPHANSVRVLDLGMAAVGLTVQANLNVANDGTDTLRLQTPTLEGAGAASFGVAAAGLEVVPRASTTLVVTFRPTAEGPVTATLVIPSNARDNPSLRVTLTGVGLPPAITVEPLALNFGEVLPGQFRQMPLTLRNHTAEAVEASLYTQDDATLAFSMEGAAVGGQVAVRVAGNGDAQVNVRFAPNRGGHATANLRVDSCGSGCGVAVPLTGVMAAPRLDVTPLLLDFGRLASGQQSEEVLTFANLGTLPLTVTSGTLNTTAGAFTLLDTFPITLAADAQQAFRVRYAAVNPGRSDARLTLVSNDPRTPESVILLTGSTSGSDVTAVPAAVNFGVIPNANLVTRNVVVLNRGDEEASLETVSVTGGAFSLDSGGMPPLPYRLGAGSSLLVTVQFSSAPLGVFHGTLNLTTNSVGHESLVVALEATRADRSCNVTPSTTEVNLGAIRLGQQAQQAFTIRNMGTGVCTVMAPVAAPGFANDGAFSFSGDSGDLQPGDLRRLNVVFSPTTRGTLRSVAQLTVAGGPPILVTARGRGSVAGVSVNPAFLDLGAVPVNCGSSTKSLSVLSDGAESVIVDAPTLSSTPPFTLGPHHLPRTMLPGSAETLAVSFTPTSVSVFTGEIRVMAHLPDAMELVVGLRGEGVAMSTPVTEEFTVSNESKMDVLFVVDNSGSMEDNQMNLAANAARFIQVADFRSSVDYQLGVTTTDTFVEQGALIGSPAIIRRTSGDPAALFTARATPGTSGSGYEQGLEAARLALSPPMVTGANAGFLRADAGLALVIVSDEEDSSQLTVQEYLNFFNGLKAGTGASVIISAISGQPAGCATAQAETRYSDAVAATGGISASICDADWGTKLQRIGEAALLARGRFHLNGTPQPGSLTVTLDGHALTSGWRFDGSSNSVILDPTSVPAPGSHVTVTYIPQC